MHRLVLLLLCLSTAAALAVDDPTTLPAPKRVTIPKLAGPLVIDGQFDEPVWSRAAMITDFAPNNGKGKARVDTTVRLWYDDQALYLAWICQDPDIQATFTKRDSMFWTEEVVEMFLAPGDITRYFEFEWNPLNGVFDATMTNNLDAKGVSKNFTGDWGYTATGMTNRARVVGTVGNAKDQDQQWTVEVRLPFSDLHQAPPKPGDVWRVNFYRFSRDTGLPTEELAWSPTLLPGFHQPTRFGFLEFGKPVKAAP